MTEDNKKELNLENLEQITGGASSQPSGMPCPTCGGFIPVTMQEITTASCIHCPSCGLTLNINQQEARPAIEAIKKFMK